METIAQHGGGPVSTAQLAALFWPPDLPRALAWWGLDPATVAALLDQYPAAHIGQRLELAKFLSKLARIAPEQLKGLHPLYQQVLAMDSGEWLKRVIGSDIEAPEIFTHRVRRPSEFVSSAAKAGLQYLVASRLLVVDEMGVRRREGSGQYLYYLTAKGRRRLADELGVGISEVSYRKPGQLSDFKVLHHLQCVDLAVAVHLSCRRLGYRIVGIFA